VEDNSTTQSVSVQSIHWKVGIASGTLATNVNVEPGATQRLSIPMPSTVVLNAGYFVQLKVFYDHGQEETYSGYVTNIQ
jgi:hypothetical protein